MWREIAACAMDNSRSRAERVYSSSLDLGHKELDTINTAPPKSLAPICRWLFPHIDGGPQRLV